MLKDPYALSAAKQRLFEHRLAEILRRPDSPPDHPEMDRSSSVITAINPNQTGLPVFCLEPLYLFAQEISADHPVYFIDTRKSIRGGSRYSSVVRQTIKSIESIQPEGPYLIVGFCMTCRMAIDVAHQMERRGSRTRTILFNPPALAREQDMAARFTRVKKRLKRLSALREQGLRAVWDRLKQRYRMRKHHWEHVDMAQPLSQPLRGNLFIFSADSNLETRNLQSGWSQFSLLPEEYWYKGDHFSVVRRPHLTEILETIHPHLS